jgi:hypothetical protein
MDVCHEIVDPGGQSGTEHTTSITSSNRQGFGKTHSRNRGLDFGYLGRDLSNGSEVCGRGERIGPGRVQDVLVSNCDLVLCQCGRHLDEHSDTHSFNMVGTVCAEGILDSLKLIIVRLLVRIDI